MVTERGLRLLLSYFFTTTTNFTNRMHQARVKDNEQLSLYSHNVLQVTVDTNYNG